ncbi:MAG: hypothetical protein COA75_08445 [Cellvibrionales bacterium]|nr:MAG: hypothetical protein COA75_08445 [Cellvibrionales bacterium]
MNFEVNIRPVSPKDADQYLYLRAESEVEYPEYVGPSVEKELLAGTEGVAELLTSYPAQGTLIVGAFYKEELVGVIATSRRLSPKIRHRAFIWGMYIVKKYRKYNLGASLLKYSLTSAINSSEVNIVWLQVTTTNIPAISFYKKYGFSIYGTEQQALYAAGKFHDVHYMEYVIEK